MENERQEHRINIEKYKTQLEELKTNALRYSGKQFELYSQLWRQLCDLEDIADVLWERARRENLEQFVSNLLNTKKEVKRSRLFLEDKHYKDLLNLFNKFEEYKIGKIKLLEMTAKISQTSDIVEDQIYTLIINNKENKNEYKELVDKIGNSLRKQLRIDK